MGGETKMKISKGYKVTLNTFSSLQIFFALGAIGVCIPTIVLAMQSYYECYLEIVYEPGPYASRCNLYYYLNKFSLTAQGIWTGAFVIISAAMTIDFAVRPSTKTGSFSIGFTILSFCLCNAMIALEAFPVSDYEHMTHNYNDDLIWSLHCVNLALACVLWILLLTSLILVSTLRCCRKKTQVFAGNPPVPQVQIPMATQQHYAASVGVPYVISPQPTFQNMYVAQAYPGAVLAPPPQPDPTITPHPVGSPQSNQNNEKPSYQDYMAAENGKTSAF